MLTLAASEEEVSLLRNPQSFIVRIWLEVGDPTPAWRASVTNPNTSQRRFFSSAEGLAAFLGAWPDVSLSEVSARDDPQAPVLLEQTALEDR